MPTLITREYTSAIENWNQAKSNYSEIQSVISPENVFTLYPDQVEWLNAQNDAEAYFCLEIGIFNNQLILICSPRTSTGDMKILPSYEYTTLAPLQSDLKLTQTKTYTLTSHYTLSVDLTKSKNDSDVNFPIMNQPVTGQQIAVDEIESWRENGMDWLSLESNEFNGERIFQNFFVPKQDLLQNPEDTTSIIGVFGLKYSPVYQRLLPTIIFISCFDDASAADIATRIPSNTYDWTKPSPPYRYSIIIQ